MGKAGTMHLLIWFLVFANCFILKLSVGNSVVQRVELDRCFVDEGMHGGNMAAADPAECPPKPQKSPAEELETFGLGKWRMEAGCTPKNDVEATPSKATESLGNEQSASVSIIGCVANRSEGTSGSGDGSDKTTFSLPDNTISANKMTDPAGNDGWGFDWSETEEEDTEPRTQKREHDGECVKLTFVLVVC